MSRFAEELLVDNRFTPAAELFMMPSFEPEHLDTPSGPVIDIPVTDEMRIRDAEERAARERKPPISATPQKPRPTERDLDAYWAQLDSQEKYWLFEAAANKLAEEARCA